MSERFVRMLTTKNCSYMSSILKDVYNDKDSKFKVVKFVIVSSIVLQKVTPQNRQKIFFD